MFTHRRNSATHTPKPTLPKLGNRDPTVQQPTLCCRAVWTVLSAHFGCRTIGIEPQPQCIASAATGLKVNGLSARIINALLAPSPITLRVDTSKPCFGGFQGSGPGRNQSGERYAQVASLRLDDLAELRDERASVVLWHLDVEGAEILVLRPRACGEKCPPFAPTRSATTCRSLNFSWRALCL